jgi:hypothetical protein
VGTVMVPGGVRALPTNIGHYAREEFAVVPETILQMGYQPVSSLRFFIGYNFLYMSNVLRPGGTIDTRVNAYQIPSLVYYNPALQAFHPVFQFHSDTFWAQGINAGIELKF